MPTTSSETPTTTASSREEAVEALDEALSSLRASEATAEQAITESVHALADLLRALVPDIVLQPARALDVTFELVQQSINLQRRLLSEVVTNVQLVVADAVSVQPYENGTSNGRRSSGVAGGRRQSTRTAA